MLTKLADRQYIPGVPGQAHSPAYTVCSGGEAPGHWETICETVCVPADPPPGAPPGGGYDGPGYICFPMVCRTEWVVDGPPSPVVCQSYPEIPFIAPVPPRVVTTPIRAWNAGANSIAELDGDLRLAFTMPRVIGVVLGITSDRGAVIDNARCSHAIYFFQTAGGAPRYRLREFGTSVSPEAAYAPDDEFEIRRVGGAVQFLRNGVRLRRSPVPSAGMVSVGSALFATGDTVP